MSRIFGTCVVVTLLSFSMIALGDSPPSSSKPSLHPKIDETNPYFQIATSEDDAQTVFIGAFTGYEPVLTGAGDVAIRVLMKHNISRNGYVAGSRDEYLLIANCDKQMFKLQILWHFPDSESDGVSAFPKLSGKALTAAIVDQLNTTQSERIIPDTLIM